jgi:hypothetical protein
MYEVGVGGSLLGLWGWLLWLRKRQEAKQPGDPAPLINEYLKRRRAAEASGRCPFCSKPLVVNIDSKGKPSKPECPECNAKGKLPSR